MSKSEVLWSALQAVLEHGAADDLPGVLAVAQHDALVHNHTCKIKTLKHKVVEKKSRFKIISLFVLKNVEKIR